jgi:hypothetical protein
LAKISSKVLAKPKTALVFSPFELIRGVFETQSEHDKSMPLRRVGIIFSLF